ncbi:MAG: tRNA epoxyqueuosine(34) reductase QueG [Deltaproteobacteria bacterium]|nr:tRNA epoxyqueuosine(34) reductase QueG [Deltaproteobacteria bacterium]
MTDTDLIIKKSHELGFDAVGITREFAPAHRDYFLDWLDKGRHAEMDWLYKSRGLKLSPDRIMKGTRSAIVLAASYHHKVTRKTAYAIARYARGTDYHGWIKQWLEELAVYIKQQIAPSFQWRSFVDTGPVLERDLAEKAGLGWIGKNTCLINKDLGSYVFLGVIFCNLLFCAETKKAKNLCGQCDLCVKACPTGALTPFKLDAGKCLAYHNIEKRGERAKAVWKPLHNRLVGCDICQEVCPRNIRARAGKNVQWLEGYEETHLADIAGFLELDKGGYQKKFKHTAISRVKYQDFMRNVFIVIANLKRKDLIEQVKAWKIRNPHEGLAELEFCIGELEKEYEE